MIERIPSSDTLEQLSQIFQTDIASLLYDEELHSKAENDFVYKSGISGDVSLEITKENLNKYRKYFETAYNKAIEIAFQNHDSNKEWVDIKNGQTVTHQELLDTFQNPTDELILETLEKCVKTITINETFQTLSIGRAKANR